jgi:hypothetical protein
MEPDIGRKLLTTRGKDKVESMFEGLLVFDRTFRD